MMHDKPKRSVNSFSVLLIGSAIGAVIAMLVAPRNGQENRDMFKQRANEMRDKVQSTIKDKRGEASQAADKASELLKDASGKAETAMDNASAKTHTIADEFASRNRR